MSFIPLLDRRPSTSITFALGLVGVLAIGELDYFTGYEVSMFMFYGIPIVSVAWFGGKKPAILLALLAGIIWWWADQLAMHPYRWGWLEAWETSVRLSFFLFAAASGAALKGHYDSVKARIGLLEHSQRLEQEIVAISEQEQRRLGQDLHDGICQVLTALGYSAASLQADLHKAGRPEWASCARDLSDRLKESVKQTRDLARGLVPVQMDEAGLASALEELAITTTRHVGIDCVFRCYGDVLVSDYAAASHLYRIAQEAINNAIKHARANRIEVCLNGSESGVELKIQDDGIGLTAGQESSTGMGLRIMRYRSRCIGHDLEVVPGPDGGTMVCCNLRQESCG